MEDKIEYLKQKLDKIDRNLAGLYKKNRLLTFRIDKLQQSRIKIANELVLVRQALSEQRLRELFGYFNTPE
tara:strand:- start:675 stop:887 length:213 start_codon:yes stop_codon:yes gene_type:complete